MLADECHNQTVQRPFWSLSAFLSMHCDASCLLCDRLESTHMHVARQLLKYLSIKRKWGESCCSHWTFSTYKIRPELNKGAVCFSTTDSSCHLAYDEVLLLLLAAAPACHFYLLHVVTSHTSDFTNSLTRGSVLMKFTPKNPDWRFSFSFLSSLSIGGIEDVAHLQTASGMSSLPAQIDIGHLTKYWQQNK